VDFSLTALYKSDTSPEIFQSKFLEVCGGLEVYKTTAMSTQMDLE